MQNKDIKDRTLEIDVEKNPCDYRTVNEGRCRVNGDAIIPDGTCERCMCYTNNVQKELGGH